MLYIIPSSTHSAPRCETHNNTKIVAIFGSDFVRYRILPMISQQRTRFFLSYADFIVIKDKWPSCVLCFQREYFTVCQQQRNSRQVWEYSCKDVGLWMSDMFSYILPLVTLQRFATMNRKIRLEIYECSVLLKKKRPFSNSMEVEGPSIYVL
jgi:hypothetical protein